MELLRNTYVLARTAHKMTVGCGRTQPSIHFHRLLVVHMKLWFLLKISSWSHITHNDVCQKKGPKRIVSLSARKFHDKIRRPMRESYIWRLKSSFLKESNPYSRTTSIHNVLQQFLHYDLLLDMLNDCVSRHDIHIYIYIYIIYICLFSFSFQRKNF